MQTADHYADEIELIDVLRVLWKRKFLIIGIVLCVAVIVPAALWMKFPGHRVAKSTISLNFKGIEAHKNPDGTVFKPEQIIAPVVLNNAFDRLAAQTDRNITGHKSEIINNIDVMPVVPGKIEKKIADAEKEGEVYNYYPHQFVISYDATARVLDSQEQAMLLQNVINAYAAFFQQEYSDIPLLKIDFPDNFLEDNDYIDIVTTFDKAIERILALVTPRINQAGLYKMRDQEYTFYRLKSDLEVLRDTTFANVSAIIRQLQMSRDADVLVRSYEYKIAQLELEKEKFKGKAIVSRDLLNEMNQPKVKGASQGLGNSLSETNANFLVDSSLIENLRKNESVDYLLKTYLEAQVKANNADVDIAAYQNKIKSLKEENEDKVTPADIAYVKSALTEIKNKIVTYSAIANQLNIKLLTKRNEHAVTMLRQPQVFFIRGVNIPKISLLAVFCSIFLAVFAAFLVEYISSARAKDARNVSETDQQDQSTDFTEVELFSQKSGRSASNS